MTPKIPEPFTLGVIVKRLREQAATFNRQVGGTAALAIASNQDTDVAVPHAFVVPITETAEPRTNLGEAQRVTEQFAIIVCVENEATNGLGMMAADRLRLIRAELFKALLGWETGAWYDTITFVGGRHLSMTRTRLWHQYDFRLSYYVGPTRPVQETPQAVEEVYRRYQIEAPDVVVPEGAPLTFPGTVTPLSEDFT